ncbi:hypothetical protein SAMN05443574_1165 [Haloarcula vallismortis]|uniref:Uncharacterized protein n=1 Tax=Haloarcula vallismortis TaxID=28442 RepID=A0A1H2ZEE8_HALVA|nr:hypothetical protein SAMN05443574_1165 [Haloarcula vallismortis]
MASVSVYIEEKFLEGRLSVLSIQEPVRTEIDIALRLYYSGSVIAACSHNYDRIYITKKIQIITLIHIRK